MDVFLIPTGPSDYELYTEHVDETSDDDAEPPPGLRHFFARMKHRFRQMLAEAERDRRRGHASHAGGGWTRRVTRRVMRWVVESIAEQRLLWNLRRTDRADFFYPSDMTEADAVAILRQQLNRDFEKHRFWLAIDALLGIASGALIVIPGPNVLGYYFVFRVVGHYFSVRGARRGLAVVQWTNAACEPLTDLRRAADLDPMARLTEVERIGAALRLEHLATFFQRVYSPR